jgi:hypothetical protein
VADNVQVIECPECGRLHEVDLSTAHGGIECDCGHSLEVPSGPPESSAAGDGGESEVPSPSRASTVEAVKRHWKPAVGIAAGIAAAMLAVAFWRGPEPTLAFFGLGGGRSSARRPGEDPEVYLRALEDNTRAEEHGAAAAKLLQMNHAAIVPRLCEMVRRDDLASRNLIICLLGQKGDKRALEALEVLIDDKNQTLAFAATTAVALIGTPLAESILRERVRMPSRGRLLLPSIAAARNPLAGRVLMATLKNPALRTQALDEIGKARLDVCIPALVRLAQDRSAPETDRARSVETLARLDTVAARHALVRLTDNVSIGWKARQVLEQKPGS